MGQFYKKTMKTVFISVFVVLAATKFAFAVDKDAFAQRLKTTMDKNFIPLSIEEVTASGNDVVLHDTVATIEGKTVEENVKLLLGDLVFENISEDEEGNYKVEHLKINQILSSVEDVTIKVDDFEVSDLFLLSEHNTNKILNLVPYGSYNFASLQVLNGQKLVFDLKNLKTATTLLDDNLIDISSNAESFSFNPAATEEKDIINAFSFLNKDVITGAMTSHVVWDIKSGVLDIDKSEIVLDDAGKFNLKVAYGGLTMDFIDGYTAFMRKIQNEIIAGNNATFENRAKNQQDLLQLLSEISVDYFEFRFDNNSFYEKLIAFIAARSGVTSGDLILQTKQTLPLLAMFVNDENFVSNTIEQLTAFLDTPQSLTIETEKGKSVKLSAFKDLVAVGPTPLIQALGLKVLANQ